MQEPTTRTTHPMVTGTSVLAVKYAGGVLLSADTLGSYGSMARYREVSRFHSVGSRTMIGVSGDYSDFQQISKLLDELMRNDAGLESYPERSPKEIHEYLVRVMCNRRNKMDPLWNAVIVAGIDKESSFVGVVDLQGSNYCDHYAATGFGTYLAMPVLRDRWVDGMSRADAQQLLEDAMRVLLYRDTRTINKIEIADVTADGATIHQPVELESEWESRGFVNPTTSGVEQKIRG